MAAQISPTLTSSVPAEAMENLSRPLLLTSRVCPLMADGNYPFEHMAFLIPHEGIRREMALLSKALKHIDCGCSPWKLLRLDQWLNDFFVPMVHEHHDLEELVVFTFYAPQGVVTPETLTNEHVVVLALLEALAKHARVGANALREKNMKLVESSVVQMRKVFAQFDDFMNKHLDEEETFWPPIIKAHGSEQHDKLTEAIVKEGGKNGGLAFELSVSMVVTALGLNPQSAFPTTPWCSKEVSAHWLSAFPVDPFQTKVLPQLLAKYEKYRAMIESIVGETDLAAKFEYSSGHCCVVS